MWFKELESYRRIDTMCTLLHMCLPFELRFLGTCLEELGRRDSQELRGIELRVNNAAELAGDVAACRLGEPTDLKIRRKMAMYLALIRACSRSCVTELFQTLDGWGDRDFLKFGDGDPLQELLLVYTMASNHPVFSFEQRMKCGEIYTRINDCNRVLSEQRSPSASSGASSTTGSSAAASAASSATMAAKQLPQHIVTPPPHVPKQQQTQPMMQQPLAAGLMLTTAAGQPVGQIPLGFAAAAASASGGQVRAQLCHIKLPFHTQFINL